MAGERTEKATPKRRQDERKKGNVFQSRDICVALNLLVMFVALKCLGAYLYKYIQQTMVLFFKGAGNIKSLNYETVSKITTLAIGRTIVPALPLLLISGITYFLLSGFQTRFIFNTKRLAFKLERLNPLNGLKNFFSIRSYAQLIKSILIIVVVGLVIYSGIKDFSNTLLSYYSMPVAQTVYYVGNSVFNLFIKVCAVVVAIGILDYFYQWWHYEKSIRMTKQEIKEEYKMMEGDPVIKSELKNRQRKIATTRMMQRIPHADVVIANPQHYAVALKYDAYKNDAPVVIAKGRDYIALKIKEAAAEHGIRIEENPPLARALYKSVDIDCEIPPEFYQAVAEVLSYVYGVAEKDRI
ncbi:MAG: flagellar biosynthesis protein FlhB [Oscillospiraceae bacterium]|nr:flagellar biosynthesis protein FlhB [Oscillospiraceae bacterium]